MIRGSIRTNFGCKTCMVALLLLGRDGRCAPEVNHLSAPGVDITVVSVVRYGAEERAPLQIEMSYSFAGRATVWLEGIGDVPGAANIRYAVRKGRVLFRVTKNGMELGRLTLIQTGFHQAPSTGEHFPSSNETETHWIPDGAPIVLKHNMPSGTSLLINGLRDSVTPPGLIATPCRPDDEGCIVTEWKTISPASAPVIIQLALMITYVPIKAANQTVMRVKVYFAARDAFQGSGSWNYSLGDNSNQACKAALAAYRTILYRSVTGH